MVPCKSGFTPDVSLNIETRLTGTELAVPPLSPASPAPPLPALELRESAYRRLSAALKSWEVPAHLPPAPKIVIPRDGQPPRPAPSPVAKALPESVAGDESIRDILGVVSRKIPVLRDSVRTTQAQLLDQLVGLFKLGVTQVPAPSTFWRPATSPPVRTPTILDLPLPELSALSDSGGEPVRLFIGEVTEAHREAVDWLGTPESDEVVRALTPHTLSTAAGTLVHLLSLLTRILGVQNKLTFIPVADAAVPRLEKKFTKSSNFTSEGVRSTWHHIGRYRRFGLQKAPPWRFQGGRKSSGRSPRNHFSRFTIISECLVERYPAHHSSVHSFGHIVC
ncbi:MAG: uncharacterized protein KVP18_000586 [Porospora cf. gigantea A]|uniref:uncharacterized protein n=1 Tax=Porospora cf. gigantea A TaxID=2853593 RepID=UPI0035598732|nr:MAG: hypothetical protein KVP18_000586 [Porospora cf. gigantea A]